MGEVFHALQYLNRTMNLGLNPKDLLRAEMGFKTKLEKIGNPAAQQFANDPVGLAENFETVTVLRPRAQKLNIADLQKFATAHVRADLKANVLGKQDITLDMLSAKSRVAQVAVKSASATKMSVVTNAVAASKVSAKVSAGAIKKTPTR